MKRHPFLVLGVVSAMIGIAALAPQKDSKLLVLEWAHKAKEAAPPRAIVIEFGLKDDLPTVWSGRAVVTGATVVQREGYRFRKDDKLIDPNAWEAKSHRALRGPAGMPKAVKVIPERIATVGVVLHLADVKPEATLKVDRDNQDKDWPAIPLKDVLEGKRVNLGGGQAVVRLVSTTTSVVTAKTEDDFPAACYGPDGTLWVAYISYTVKDDSRRIESPPYKKQPENFKDLYTPEFGDQLFVKSYKDGKWSEPIAITGPKEDLMRCAIAAEGDGTVWVAYSANRQGKHLIYGVPLSQRNAEIKVGAEETLGEKRETTSIGPVAISGDGARGTIFVFWQTWETNGDDRFSMIKSARRVNGKWDKGGVGEPPYCIWNPSVAQNDVLCYDINRETDYDIRLWTSPFAAKGMDIASSDKFEARPSIAYDPAGRLWIAYEEGPEKWGKDFGALDDKDGNPLYFARTVKVVCLVDGKLMKPVAELPALAQRSESPDTGQKVESMPRQAYPKIGIDGKGRVWLTYREKFGSRYTTHPGSYWLTMARRLDGDRWTDPIEVHHSDGLLDDRPVLLPHPAGGLRIIHNTDGRYTTPEVIDNQIYMSYVDLPGEPGALATGAEPKLVPHDPGKKDPKLVEEAKREREAINRIREYRMETKGKKLQLLRGEFHRHTELSWDGGPDGSLEDMFRYGIDAAGFDWIGNGDHDNGAGREYAWWLVQKLTDAYTVKDRFTGMFTYERSVAYPHGHRNCMFARRGVRTLPRLAEEDPEKRVGGVHADDTKMLYRYLKELDGICAIHTSATGMGTDWRDNDPVVEPIVEIYQGDRMSYEIEGAPRAGYDVKSGKKPVNIAGWYPKGFINLALQKGHRLGFQASSDHFSTHISYMIVLAEKNNRDAILAAVKKRHVYGATDNIICDVQCGEHIMGDEFKLTAAPTLKINVIGAGPIVRIDILKDSEVVDTIKPEKSAYQGVWTDSKPSDGVHYYYIRVQQADDELAWTSPMWIEYAK